MPASKLPLTGKCYYCGNPTPHRFCNNDCGRMYNYRKTHPVAWQKKSTRELFGTKSKPRRASEEARIDNVVLKAYYAGTLLNNFERMRIEQGALQ